EWSLTVENRRGHAELRLARVSAGTWWRHPAGSYGRRTPEHFVGVDQPARRTVRPADARARTQPVELCRPLGRMEKMLLGRGSTSAAAGARRERAECPEQADPCRQPDRGDEAAATSGQLPLLNPQDEPARDVD